MGVQICESSVSHLTGLFPKDRKVVVPNQLRVESPNDLKRNTKHLISLPISHLPLT
jgi:hypothetical protein